MSTHAHDAYYIPNKAVWPVIGTVGLVVLLAGFANYLNGNAIGSTFMIVGLMIFIVMLAGWFTLQSNESESGMYNHGVGISYRMGMMWFIFSEIMFFAVFFGTLWYTRNLSVDWLGGIGDGPGRVTHDILWNEFKSGWPTNGPEHLGLKDGAKVKGAEFEPMGAFGLPFLNTLLLLSSGVTCTWAHHGLLAKKRDHLIKGLIATVSLGFLFVACQAIEYHEAYTDMGLTLGSGIYGSTFFMLTGFHGLHVCIGAIILSVVLFRSAKGHFTPENHFAFEAAAWYWHFVDVVWLGLFIFVYLM
jgi:cytochrome c oxidase subunit III